MFEGLEAGETEVLVVAVLTVPHLGEPPSCDAALMEGAEASVAAIDLSLAVALEAVIIVELILVHRLLVLHHAVFRSMLAASVCWYSCDFWLRVGLKQWLHMHN